MDTTLSVQKNDYYGRVNINFLALNWIHLLIVGLAGWLHDSSQSFLTPALMALVILAGPTYFVLTDKRSVTASIANAMALVSFSALLIHVTGGMTEMHFHVFASLGVMIMLAQPAAVIGALLVVVVHHVGFFFLLPKSLINYDAGFGILVIHAVFALSVGVPAFFIARKYNLYIVGVREIVDEIQTISTQLASTSDLMLGTSNTLTSATGKEAAALHETAASLEQLDSMIAQNSNSAQVAANASEVSKGRSESGVEVMDQVVASLGEISQNSSKVMNAIQTGNKGMEQIISLIDEIGSKTKVINDIVFQTKLLSFNASVEAARAGEHGKGFAVVAEEIGKLAQMSGSSAKEITVLLDTSTSRVKNIIEETSRGVNSILADGKDKIEHGLRVADECKSILTEVDQNLNEVSKNASQIALASKEQALGVIEIKKAMTDVETVSSENSKASEKATQIAKDLAHGAQSLQGALRKLLKAVGDKNSDQEAA
jgi:methyl-accepting chemotaxis protein